MFSKRECAKEEKESNWKIKLKKSIIEKSGKKDLVWNPGKQSTKMFVSVKGIPALIIST